MLVFMFRRGRLLPPCSVLASTAKKCYIIYCNALQFLLRVIYGLFEALFGAPWPRVVEPKAGYLPTE